MEVFVSYLGNTKYILTIYSTDKLMLTYLDNQGKQKEIIFPKNLIDKYWIEMKARKLEQKARDLRMR